MSDAQKTRNILLFTEDHDLETSFMEWSNEREAFHVLSTVSFNQIMDAGRKYEAAAFVLDHDLMDEEGAANLFQILKLAFPHTPIFIATAPKGCACIIEMLKRGAFYTLAKPVNLSEFEIALDSNLVH